MRGTLSQWPREKTRYYKSTPCLKKTKAVLFIFSLHRQANSHNVFPTLSLRDQEILPIWCLFVFTKCSRDWQASMALLPLLRIPTFINMEVGPPGCSQGYVLSSSTLLIILLRQACFLFLTILWTGILFVAHLKMIFPFLLRISDSPIVSG